MLACLRRFDRPFGPDGGRKRNIEGVDVLTRDQRLVPFDCFHGVRRGHRRLTFIDEPLCALSRAATDRDNTAVTGINDCMPVLLCDARRA
ncbi:hypothetical protein D3C87_1475800 [compost metagenome]